MPADTPMVPCPATPAETLRDRIMDPNVAKSEAEWWAARRIEELEAALSASPAREGDLGSSASPIPTEQAGGPVVGDPTPAGWRKGDLLEVVLPPVRHQAGWEHRNQPPLGAIVVSDGMSLTGKVYLRDYEPVFGWHPSRFRPVAAPSTTSTAEQVGDERAAYEQYAKDCGFEFPPEGLSLKEWGWQLWRNAREIAPSPGEGDAPVASGEDPHEMFEAFVAEAVATSPEPLQELGRFLADRLDEDDWKTADRLLLQLATHPTPATPEGLREALKLRDDLRKFADGCIEARQWGGPTIWPDNPITEARARSAVKALDAILAALQPQAGEGE